MDSQSDFKDVYSDDPFEEESTSHKFQIISIIAALLCLAFVIRGVYAANITLNTGNPAEFGQGINTAVACSGNNVLSITPKSTFVNASGTGAFYLSGIQVTGVPSGCNGKKLVFNAFGDSNADALPIFATDKTDLSITSTGSTFITSNSGVTLSGLSATGFTATFTNPVTLTSDFVKIVVQSTNDSNFENLGSITFSASDALSFPALTSFGTGAYTAEMWIKFTSTPSSNALIFQGNSGLGLYINSSLDQVFIVKWGDGTGTKVFYIPALSTGTWYHLAVVRDSSSRAQLFIDGSKSINAYVTDNNNYTSGITSLVTGGAGGKFVGKLSNIRITNTAIYDPTVTSFTKPSAPLTDVSGTLLLLNTKTTAPLTDSSSFAHSLTESGNPTSSTDNPFD